MGFLRCRGDPMKRHKRAWLLAMTMMGAAGAGWAQGEMYRCELPSGVISFQPNPCPLSDLLVPAPAAPSVTPVRKPDPAPVAKAPASATPAAPRPVAAERSVTTPE